MSEMTVNSKKNGIFFCFTLLRMGASLKQVLKRLLQYRKTKEKKQTNATRLTEKSVVRKSE